MVVFSVLMIAAALSMIRKGKFKNTTIIRQQINNHWIIGGACNRFSRAQGQFLIVPALLFYANLDLKYAIATSVFYPLPLIPLIGLQAIL